MPTVRRPPRSKGCAQCIQRHVKCDERAQICRQCMRFGLPCSGPIQGPIILDMTDKVVRRNRKVGPKSRRQKNEGRADPVVESITIDSPARSAESFVNPTIESPQTESASPSTQLSVPSEDDTESCTVVVSPQYDPRLAFRPDKRVDFQAQFLTLQQLYGYEVFEECFIGQFVDLVTSPRETITAERPRSWFFSITDFLVNPSRPSVKYCIRAVALAYYSVMYRNKSAEIDAIRWYLAGLESQRNAMVHLHRGTTDDEGGSGNESALLKWIPDCQDICVPMMFSYFESMKGSVNAWAQHLTAAVEMILVRGAPNCRNGQEHAMFRSIRPYEAFRAILCGQRSKLDSSEWCVIPFCDHVKLPLDYLVDILLSMPGQLSLPHGKSLRHSIDKVSNLSDAAKENIESVVYGLLHKLQDWWWHFEKDSGVLVQPSDNLNITGAFTNELPIPSSVPYVYRDTLTATSIAIYNATIIILYSILLNLAYSKPPSPLDISPIPRYQSSISSHSASVLNVVAFQSWNNPFCGDTGRTLFPVQIVVLLALDEAHLVEAQKYMNTLSYNIDIEASTDNSFAFNA